MTFISILLGLFGLGIVVFVHELGHLIAAKSAGIEVEAFSIGWGKKLVGIEWKGTEYRISLIPIGGYCRMKGEEIFRQAWLNKTETIPQDEEGAFYTAKPWKRIIVALSGPAVNFLFSVIVLSVIWYIGFEIQSYPNKIILQSDFQAATAEPVPAEQAGLETGDIITAINGDEISHFRDIEEHVAPAAGKELAITVRRNGKSRTYRVTPRLDKNSGAGKLGVYAWIEPVIGSVEQGSAADLAGLQSGDRIVSVNDSPIRHSLDFLHAVEDRPDTLRLTVERGGRRRQITMQPDYGEDGTIRIGFNFAYQTYETDDLSVPQALVTGVKKSAEIVALTVRSIGLLFSGVNVTKAVAGPVRITYLVGEVATEGFKLGFGAGLSAFFNFLSLLSVALFFMNLLPIPALDGGQIILFAYEGITGRPLKTKAVYRYQMVGMILIFILLFFALFNDVLFFIRG
jgi:regulator of sigma E protease